MSSSLEKCFAADHELLHIMVGWVVEALDRRLSSVEVARQWAECERHVIDHMEIEETHLLSELGRTRAADAERLRADHLYLRDRMTELREKARRGELSTRELTLFIEELDAHTTREQHLLYAWCAETLSLPQLSKILSYMSDVSRRRTEDSVSTRLSPL